MYNESAAFAHSYCAHDVNACFARIVPGVLPVPGAAQSSGRVVGWRLRLGGGGGGNATWLGPPQCFTIYSKVPGLARADILSQLQMPPGVNPAARLLCRGSRTL